MTRIHFAHTLLRARDYQDRPEFEQLCDWWRGGGAGVCALVGIGGAGKTALAERFLRMLPNAMSDDPKLPKDDSLPAPSALFVISFYDAPNPESFFAQLAAWLKDEAYDESAPRPSYYQTLALLQKAPPLLLVLDGLEKVQDDGLRGGVFGQIVDGSMRDFVRRMAEGYLKSVSILITTRFVLDDLEYGQSPHYRPIPIETLSRNACIALLRQRGVKGKDADLSVIAGACGLHALTVDLTGGYIAHFGKGAPKTPLDLPSPAELQSIAAETRDRRFRYVAEQSARFARLAERYRESFAKSDPAALALLERVCLFRLGVTTDLIASIFTGDGKEGISGKALAALSRKELGAKLALLTEMHLLQRSQIAYSVHPAIRDGS